jgi:hypothetical protein
MKQQYFGDVNDYVKYGLLRCFSAAGLRVGVCWMMTPEDGRSDGNKTSYLGRPEEWAGHDGELFAALQTLTREQDKSVAHFEQSNLLLNALFYDALVPDATAVRNVWFQQALAKLGDSELIFFDPDNGIEVSSKPAGRKDSSKYVLWAELERTWQTGKALLIFQHFPRISRDVYISSQVGLLRGRLAGAKVETLSSANVLFLLAYRSEHDSRVQTALEFLQQRWAQRVVRCPL